MYQEKTLNFHELFEQIAQSVISKSQGQKPAMMALFQEFINFLMLKERELFLKENPDNKANGFYNRSLALSFAKLNLKIPRVRFGNSFRPALLPDPWKRANKDYEEVLLSLLVNGYQVTQIKKALNSLDIPFSQDALDNLSDLICEKLEAFRSQPLQPDWFAIFIDAFHAKLRLKNGRIKKISIFTAVGLDFSGHKHILGYWIYHETEKLDLWTKILKDLLSRGVSRVLIFVTDDFSGLTKVIRKLFPEAHHQLCLTHFRRNLKKNLSKELYLKAKNQLQKLYIADNSQEGEEIMAELANIVEQENKSLAKRIKSRIPHYIAFLEYPSKVRKHIYTTNPVEGLNNGLELMRRELGGYFPSERCLETNLFVQAVNLTEKWQKKPMPTVKAVEPELRRLYLLRYEMEEVDS